jgi:hypothetical protein
MARRPERQVRNALARVKRDNRHLEMMLHVAGPVSKRTFAKWAVLHDPATTWIWSQGEVAHCAVEPEAARTGHLVGYVTGASRIVRD